MDKLPQTVTTTQLLEAPASPVFEVRLRQSQLLRSAGNEAFNEGQIDDAIKFYDRAIYHANFETAKYSFEFTIEHKLQIFNSLYPAYLNLARCYLQKKQFRDAARWSSKVLETIEEEFIPPSVLAKVYYVRGKSFAGLDEFDSSKRELSACLAIQPDDIVVQKLLLDVKKREAAETKRFSSSWKAACVTSVAPSHSHDQNVLKSTGSGLPYMGAMAIAAVICLVLYVVLKFKLYLVN